MPRASPPAARISRATASAASASRSAAATRAPRRAKRSAAARPMPAPAPVTSATRPANGAGGGCGGLGKGASDPGRAHGAAPPRPGARVYGRGATVAAPMPESGGIGRPAGRVALVSGAARGQGAAEARLFAAEGAAVVLGDVLDEEGAAVAAEIGEAAAYLPLDVTREDA